MKTMAKWVAGFLAVVAAAQAQEGEKPAPAPEPAKPPAKELAKEPAKAAEPKGNSNASGITVGGTSRARRKKDVAPKVSKAFLDSIKEKGGSPAVKILIVVDEEGRVAEAKVWGESSGFPEFDEAALEAARQTPFSPKMVDGKPVKDSAIQPYRLTIRKPEEKEEQK